MRVSFKGSDVNTMKQSIVSTKYIRFPNFLNEDVFSKIQLDYWIACLVCTISATTFGGLNIYCTVRNFFMNNIRYLVAALI